MTEPTSLQPFSSPMQDDLTLGGLLFSLEQCIRSVSMVKDAPEILQKLIKHCQLMGIHHGSLCIHEAFERPDHQIDVCDLPILCFKKNVPACRDRDSLAFTQLLLESGFDLQATDSLHRNALFYALTDDCVDTAHFLIASGIQINQIERHFGESPLHWAVDFNQFETVKLLMEAGANAHFKNKRGKTALEIACLKKYTAISDYLESVIHVQKEHTELEQSLSDLRHQPEDQGCTTPSSMPKSGQGAPAKKLTSKRI